MPRCTAVISILALALLLSACDNKEEQQAASDENSQAQSVAEEPAVAEAPAPKLNYWPVVGPLIAGSYSGSCLRLPDMGKVDAAIVVDAEGKASSGTMKSDFHAAKLLMLTRAREAGGAYGGMVSALVDESKAGGMALALGGPGKPGSATLARDDITLTCSIVGGGDALIAQPLYQSVSKLLDAKKQTLGCTNLATLLTRKDVEAGVVDGVLKVGDVSFDLKTSTNEMLSFNDAGANLSFTYQLADKRIVSVGYNGAGKLSSVQAFTDSAISVSCSGNS